MELLACHRHDDREDLLPGSNGSAHPHFDNALRPWQGRNWTAVKPNYRPHLLMIVAVLGLLGLWFPLMLLGHSSYDGASFFGCDWNGNFISYVDYSGPSIWDASYTLSITLAFGKLSYTSAKLIDECWNLIIGRGAQLSGGLAVYYVFRGLAAQSLQVPSAPLQSTLRMEYSTVSLDALRYYFSESRDFGLTSKIATVLLILSTTFVLSFQTWLSAMTGYNALAIPLVALPNNTYGSASDISGPCLMVVKDGSRVGLSDYACMTRWVNPWGGVIDYLLGLNLTHPSPRMCSNISSYTAGLVDGDQYDWVTTNKSSSFTAPSPTDYTVNHTYILDPPTLQIVWSWTYYQEELQYEQPWAPCLDSKTDLWTSNWYLFTSDYIRTNGICQPQKVYQWGFSFLLTFAVLLTLTVFVVTLGIFWHFGRGLSRQNDLDKAFGSIKTAVTVTEHLRERFGKDIGGMTQHEIGQAIAVRRAEIKRGEGAEDERLQSLRKTSGGRRSWVSKLRACLRFR